MLGLLQNDNPFRDQIGQMLTRPGRTSIAIFSAMWLMPLLMTWALVDRKPAEALPPARRSVPLRQASGKLAAFYPAKKALRQEHREPPYDAMHKCEPR